MKKVLVTSYEGGQVFVDAPRNASKEDIYQAVRGYIQEKTGKPITSLSNCTYETESVWRKKKLQDEEKGQGFLWEDIPTITIPQTVTLFGTFRPTDYGDYSLEWYELKGIVKGEPNEQYGSNIPFPLPSGFFDDYRYTHGGEIYQAVVRYLDDLDPKSITPNKLFKFKVEL